LAALRKEYPALRFGRQYLRDIRLPDRGFAVHGPGEVVAWSRILDGHEVLCVLNANGDESRGADVVVDINLSPPGSQMTVILNTAEAGNPGAFAGAHPQRSTLQVQPPQDGRAYVEIRDLPPSEVLVLTNPPEVEEGHLVAGP
jgi:hypothetical protein